MIYAVAAGILIGFLGGYILGRRDAKYDWMVAVDRYETSECRQIQLEDELEELRGRK